MNPNYDVSFRFTGKMAKVGIEPKPRSGEPEAPKTLTMACAVRGSPKGHRAFPSVLGLKEKR
jgi:hypothetical protein